MSSAPSPQSIRGAHVLETLEPEEVRGELMISRHTLEMQLGRPVRAIAYPVGRLPPPHIRLAAIDAGRVHHCARLSPSILSHDAVTRPSGRRRTR
jgi:hypothetical protein